MVKRTYVTSNAARKRTKYSKTMVKRFCCAKPELKEFLGTDLNQVNPSNRKWVELINGILQGTNIKSRIGQRIRVKSIEVYVVYGSDIGNPLTCTFGDLKAASATPLSSTGEIAYPFVAHDSMETFAWGSQDRDRETFRFKKVFPGMGREYKYDRDTNNLIGDRNPVLMINNPNVVITTDHYVAWKVLYYDA